MCLTCWYYHKVWDLSRPLSLMTVPHCQVARMRQVCPLLATLCMTLNVTFTLFACIWAITPRTPVDDLKTITSECHLLFYSAVWVQALNREYMVQPSTFWRKALSLQAEAKMWLANHVNVNKSQPQARADTLPVLRYTQHTDTAHHLFKETKYSSLSVRIDVLQVSQAAPLSLSLSSPYLSPVICLHHLLSLHYFGGVDCCA